MRRLRKMLKVLMRMSMMGVHCVFIVFRELIQKFKFSKLKTCGYLLFHDYIMNKSGPDQNSCTVIDHGFDVKRNPVQFIKQSVCASLFYNSNTKLWNHQGSTQISQSVRLVRVRNYGIVCVIDGNLAD